MSMNVSSAAHSHVFLGAGHDKNERRTWMVIALCAAMMVAEIVGVAPRVAVGQRGEQERAGMGRHVQTIGDQRDRAEQQPADDLGHHHDGAKRDHRPGAALVLVVAFAEKDVAVTGSGHNARGLYFR